MPGYGKNCRYLHEHNFEQLLKIINVPKDFLSLLSLEELVIEHAIEPSFLGDNSHSLNIHKAERYGDFNIESLVYPNDRDSHISELKINLAEFSGIVKSSDKKNTEMYFNYSTAYIFVEVLSCDDIDKIHLFLHPDESRPILIERFKKVYKRWRKEGLLGTFDRLSYYITAISILEQKRNDLSNEEYLSLYRELPRFIANKINYSVEQMEEDMEKLIYVREGGLFKELNKNCSYKPAVELLRRDVYFLLKWICAISGKDNEFYLKNKWPMPDDWSWDSYPSFLSKVLEYEEVHVETIFKRNIRYYLDKSFVFAKMMICENSKLHDTYKAINKNCKRNICKKSARDNDCLSCNEPAKSFIKQSEDTKEICINNIYERLIYYEVFKLWNRAFKELHDSKHSFRESAEKVKVIDCSQNRIIDCLLLMTIRTEIIVRKICKEKLGIDKEELKMIFPKLSSHFTNNSKESSLFNVIRNEYGITRLSNNPPKLFCKIEKYDKKDKWNKETLHCFKSIIIFATARNYFAHHYYKDDEISENIDDTAGKIITSCIETIFIIDRAAQGQCFL